MVMVFGFDTETTPFNREHTPDLFGWYAYNDKITYNGSTKKGFLELVQSLYDNMTEDIVFIAQNLGFDYFMLMISESLKTTKNSAVMIRAFNHPSFAYFSKRINYRPNPNKTFRRKKTVRLNFIDLTNFTGIVSLDKIAKDFEMDAKQDKTIIWSYYLSTILDIDLQIKNYIDMMEYCRIDAKICFDVYSYIISNTLYDKVRYTINSIGYKSLKFETGWKPFERPWYIKRMERQAFHGARTGYDPDYTDRWITAWSVDIKSLYPFIMSNMKCPTAYIGEVENLHKLQHEAREIIERIYYSNDQVALIQATVLLNKPVLPYRKKKLLCFDHLYNGKRAEITGIWADNEFYPALRDGEIELLETKYIILYKAEKNLLSPFFEKRYEIKENSKGAKKAMAKLEMNGGGYGKTVQRAITTLKIGDLKNVSDLDKISITLLANTIDSYGSLDYTADSGKGRKITVRRQGDDVFIEQKENYETHGACSIVGVLTTAGARRYFWEALRKFTAISYDTDGMKVIENPYLEGLKLGDNMGDWAFDTCEGGLERCEYLVYDKKDYTCLHDSKLKGVPKKDIEGKLVRPPEKFHEHVRQFASVLKPIEAKRRKAKNMLPYVIITRTKTRHRYIN